MNKPVGMTQATMIVVLACALALPAWAQSQPGKIQTRSYQPIGKEKIQVDLSTADTGELYRDLRDYLKEALLARGTALGKSGAYGAKLKVDYAAPIDQGGGGFAKPGSPLPDRTVPAFRGESVPPPRANALHIGLTIYREVGGKVAWTGEATCYVPFASAKIAGMAMIDQLIAAMDKTRNNGADCPN